MQTTHEQLAERLRRAYGSREFPPLRDGLDALDAEGAHAVQTIDTRFWEARGRRIVGRKAGLTSRSVQAQFGIDQPDFGVLFEDGRINDGGTLDPARTLQPKAEAEVAIILATDLSDPEPVPDTLAPAIASLHPAIEIVDSRIADWKISFADTVADNGSSAFFVLGPGKRTVADIDLYSCGMVIEVNGAVVSMGAGAAVLGNPLNAACWLARTLGALREPLRAGDILLTGALGPMVTLSPGDHIRAVIGGLGAATLGYGARSR